MSDRISSGDFIELSITQEMYGGVSQPCTVIWNFEKKTHNFTKRIVCAFSHDAILNHSCLQGILSLSANSTFKTLTLGVDMFSELVFFILLINDDIKCKKILQ